MKQAFIVFKIDQGALVIHDHPVFMGDVAYDLPGANQGIPTDPEFNCREFSSASEVYTAIIDYMRQAVNPVDPGHFYVMQKNSFPNNSNVVKTKL